MSSSALPLASSGIPSFGQAFECGASSFREFVPVSYCSSADLTSSTIADHSQHAKKESSAAHFSTSSSKTHNFDPESARKAFSGTVSYNEDVMLDAQCHKNVNALQHDVSHVGPAGANSSNARTSAKDGSLSATSYQNSASASFPACQGDEMVSTSFCPTIYDRISSSVSPSTSLRYVTTSITADMGGLGPGRIANEVLGQSNILASEESPSSLECSWMDKNKNEAGNGTKEGGGIEGLLHPHQQPHCVPQGLGVLSSCK